jgi:hypothetical protein
MSALIDLHIAQTPANATFFAAALASAQAFPADVNIYSVTGQPTVLAARIAGYSQGTAPYVSLLDDDDLVENLPAVTAFLTAKSPDALYTNSNIIDSAGNITGRYFSPGHVARKSTLFNGGKSPHQLMVMKRSLVDSCLTGVIKCAEALGTTNDAAWPADYALKLEIALVTDWTYLNEVCYSYRVHTPQTSTNSNRCYGAILKYYAAKFAAKRRS